MTAIKINAITVRKSQATNWLTSSRPEPGSSTADADGFDGFALLKPTDDQKQWLVLNGWRDEESFQAWLGSESFADGHRSAAEAQGGSAPQPVARQARCGPTSSSADPIPLSFERIDPCRRSSQPDCAMAAAVRT